MQMHGVISLIWYDRLRDRTVVSGMEKMCGRIEDAAREMWRSSWTYVKRSSSRAGIARFAAGKIGVRGCAREGITK